MSEPTFIHKNSTVFNISRERAISEGLIAPTAEEAAQRNESAAAFRVHRAEARRLYASAIVALDSLAGDAERAVLDLHARDDSGHSVVCSHCVYDTEMGDHEDWPCETTVAIAAVHGIALPAMTVYREDQHRRARLQPMAGLEEYEFHQCPHEVIRATCGLGGCDCPCDPCAPSRATPPEVTTA